MTGGELVTALTKQAALFEVKYEERRLAIYAHTGDWELTYLIFQEGSLFLFRLLEGDRGKTGLLGGEEPIREVWTGEEILTLVKEWTGRNGN